MASDPLLPISSTSVGNDFRKLDIKAGVDGLTTDRKSRVQQMDNLCASVLDSGSASTKRPPL